MMRLALELDLEVVNQRDLRWYSEHPNRLYRIRPATQAEIESSAWTSSEGFLWVVVARPREGNRSRLMRVSFEHPEVPNLDSERFAREAFHSIVDEKARLQIEGRPPYGKAR